MSTNYPTVTTLSRTCLNSTLKPESYPLSIRRMTPFGIPLNIHSLVGDSSPQKLWLICLITLLSYPLLAKMIIAANSSSILYPLMILARLISAKKWMIKSNLNPRNSWANPSFSTSWSSKLKYPPTSSPFLSNMPSKSINTTLRTSRPQA